MKVQLSAAFAALVLLAGTAAAQTVIITPEQENVIREYVVTQQVQPAEIPADVTIEVGSVLPEMVEFQTLDVPDVQYSYVVVDGRTVLVEPDTRKVVHIIE